VLRSSWLQRAVGFLAGEYLRLVWRTNKFSFDPPDVYEIVEPQMPAIFAFWHGQHFMTPFIKTKESHRAKVLISLHRDGEFNAIAAERLGIHTIRGSGDHGSAFYRKGGVGAFKEMVRALEEGYSIALTADVPKRSRVAGAGHHHAGAGIGTADHAICDGDQPLRPPAQLGPHHHQFAIRRGALVGGEIIIVPPRRGCRDDGRLARATGGDPERRDPSRLCANRPVRREQVMANSLPMTLRVYQKLSAAMVPLAPALIKRRLKQGKEDPARVSERRGMSRDNPAAWAAGVDSRRQRR